MKEYTTSTGKPGVFASSAWQPIFDLHSCLASTAMVTRSRHKNLRRFLAKSSSFQVSTV